MNNRPNFALKVSQEASLDLENREPSKIRLLQYFEVFWIHNIDLISTSIRFIKSNNL